MQTLHHLRWHLALALGGALLVEWLHRLHGPIALALVALVAVDLVGPPVWRRVGWKSNRRVAKTGGSVPVAEAETAAELAPAVGRRWLPVALKRALGIDCPTCRGLGCETCAHTGLN